MENVQFIADSKYAIKKGPKFKGVKVFSLENDVLTIEMGDGRKFVSPLSELRGKYHTGNSAIGTSSTFHHSYKLQNAKGEQLKIKFSDWDGFREGLGYGDERRIKMFEIIESAENVKASMLEKIEIIVAILILIIAAIAYFA